MTTSSTTTEIEALPLSPDEAIQTVTRVLRLLESIEGHDSPLPMVRVLLRGIIGRGISRAALSPEPQLSPIGYERVITVEWDKHNARRHELIEAKRSRLLSESEIAEFLELQWLAGIKRELGSGPPPSSPEPVAADAEAKTLVRQWTATLQDGSHVTDEDAEDLTFRVLAALTAAVDKQREVDAQIAETIHAHRVFDVDSILRAEIAAAIRAGGGQVSE